MTRTLLLDCRHALANACMARGEEHDPLIERIDAELAGLDADGRNVVAMVDMAEGNESIGTAWTECAIFRPETEVAEVLEWAKETVAARDGREPRTNIVIRYAENRKTKGGAA